ncbi:hypothetical protein XF_1694 [Xylella fastidiosa 9a5c]|uniref:Bacteriocin n=1 Tax=Xylella fastidiosa (strain 9a5c) TaxID=160492 RepID=Q9PCT4_XYLFA|nr:hypothetical protein [Xylella fastidiosa]AAF84503.1 hypothetical protein XF_1694 [Xylella fastidiosa 9a5c]KFA40032.1 hypothetical protein DF22_003377 [Xylella fastidiosa]
MRELEIHEIESIGGADMHLVENLAAGVTAGATAGYIFFGPAGAALGTVGGVVAGMWTSILGG